MQPANIELMVSVCLMQKSYKQTEQLREHSYGSVTDTPELLHASYLKDVYSQVCVLKQDALSDTTSSSLQSNPPTSPAPPLCRRSIKTRRSD